MSDVQPVGSVLTGLDITISLREGDLVAGAVVLTKVVDSDGKVRLNSSWAPGMSWLERLGMLHAAIAADTPAGDDIGSRDD